MTRVLIMLVAESFAFTMLCLPALLLLVNTHSNMRFNILRCIRLASALMIALLAIDLAGTYFYLSSFTGLFIIAQYLWIIAIASWLAGRVIRLFTHSKTSI